MWNRQTGSSIPESGWEALYPGMPLSMAEKKLLLEEFAMRIGIGVTSKPVLLAQIEGITEDAARDRLRQFRQDNIEFP